MVEYLASIFDMGIPEVDLLCVEDEDAFGFANARVVLASYVEAGTLIGKPTLGVGERLDTEKMTRIARNVEISQY